MVAMDGLTVLGKFDRDDFGALGKWNARGTSTDETKRLSTTFPTVWIPDSRYLVELANAAYKERLGRDVFLTDGEYRARPTAISLFVWGIYGSRADVLAKKFGDINWQTIHDAAVAAGGWPRAGRRSRAGASSSWSCPTRERNVGGLAAMIAAAGEYYDKTNISTADVTDPKFQAWLKELMGLSDRRGWRQRVHRRGFRPVRLLRRGRRPVVGERPAQQHGGDPHALVRPVGDPLSQVRHLVRLPVLASGWGRRRPPPRRTPRYSSSSICCPLKCRSWQCSKVCGR